MRETTDPTIYVRVTRMVDGMLVESIRQISIVEYERSKFRAQFAESTIDTLLADVGWS